MTPSLLEPLWCRWKHAYRASSSEFGAVRWHQTSSNHCDEGGSRPIQGRFEWVWGGSTTPNLLEPLWCRGNRPTGQFQVSLGWFNHTEPLWISGKQAYRESWGWFNHTEPLWITGKQAYRASLSEFGVVRQHQTSSNHFAAGGSRPTGQFRVSSLWFDHIEPPRTTVMKGGEGLQGSYESVKGGSTTPNLLKPLWCRGKQA